MAAQHQRRDVASGKPGFLGDETLHARGIQHPGLAEHLVAPQPTAGPGPIGQHVDRVRHHQQRRRRCMAPDIQQDAVENGQVDAQHILTRLAWLARHPR
jgi:hypothetical protein